jgi:hypothetical protein
MSFFYTKVSGGLEFTAKNILESFQLCHLKTPTNISSRLSELCKKGKIIKQSDSYVFLRDIYKILEKEFSNSAPRKEVSNQLRTLLPKISNKMQNGFLEEVISCYEIKSYRAVIVMTWLLTIDHLYNFVFNNKLVDFNNALTNTNHKPSKVTTINDLSEYKESIFIEICRSSHILTNDQRKLLIEKLDIRNSCAHPNNIIIREAKATSYIEDLIENIILVF